VRRRELIKSAAVLGIDENHVTIVDDRGLPDDPSVEWNEDLIGKYIVEAVSSHGIKTVSTSNYGNSYSTQKITLSAHPFVDCLHFL
jgi:N-acetylglucosaminylphosphatidylinositol deacetylase